MFILSSDGAAVALILIDASIFSISSIFFGFFSIISVVALCPEIYNNYKEILKYARKYSLYLIQKDSIFLTLLMWHCFLVNSNIKKKSSFKKMKFFP